MPEPHPILGELHPIVGARTEALLLAADIERMARGCIDFPSTVATAAFDDYVERLRSVSDDLAGAFVRRVHSGLAARQQEESDG